MKRFYFLVFVAGLLACSLTAEAKRFTFDGGTEGFYAMNSCSVSASGGDLLITYNGGGDPHFGCPGAQAIDGSKDYMLVISVEMSIPGGVSSQDFQLFYRKLTDPGDWEQHSFHFAVTANVGRRVYVVHIPNDLASEGKADDWRGQTIDYFRIDPGGGYTSGSTCRFSYISLTTTQWDFNSAGNFENWWALSQIQAGSGVSGGQLTYNITPTATDPMWNSPGLDVPTDDFPWFKVRARNYTTASGAIFFYDSNLIGGYTGGHQANYALNPVDTQISEYWVNLSATGNYAAASWLDQFRFDLPDSPLPTTGSTRIDVDQALLSTTGPPTPTIESITRTGGASDSWSNAATRSWDVRFSHSMNTVNSSDFTVTRTSGSTAAGSIASVTPIGATWYRVVANVSGTGGVRLDGLANQAARDVANQAMGSAYSSGEVYLVDREAPSVPSTPTDFGAYSTSLGITFNWGAASDNGSGVSNYYCQIGTTPGGNDAFDATVGNTLAKGINGVDGKTYYCRVSALDAVGNQSAWSGNSDGITIDVTNPVPVISGATTVTNTTRQLSIDFGEDVSGFGLGGILVGQGSASNLGGGPQIWTVDISATGDTTVTVSVLAGSAVDNAGNLNAGSALFSYPFDNVNPNPAISGSTAPASVARTLTVDFLEEVDGFVEGDISVTNGAASNVQGGPQVFTFDVLGASPGTVAVQIPAGAAQDEATNLSYASNSVSFYFDATPPAPILSGDTSLTNTTRSLSVDFGEQVTGFVVGDIAVTNGAASNLSGGPIVFSFDVDGAGSGMVEVQIPAGAVQDPAANDNLASNLFSYAFDNVRPTPLITGDASLTNTTKSLSIDFGEVVTGFEVTDIAVTNGSASNWQNVDGASYTVDIEGAALGTVEVSIAAESATDAAGNLNQASNVFSFAYDATRPTTALTGEFGLTNTTRELTVTFAEAVTGFEVGDIVVTNGAASNLQNVNDAVYTVDIDGSGSVVVSVRVPENVAQDAAGNGNRASSSFQYSFDDVRPTPVISGESTLTNAARTLNIAFGEVVKSFTMSDINVVNGSASNLFNLNGGNYTVVITGSGDATVEVSIPVNSVLDNANNVNDASNTFSFPFDNVRPAPVISGETALTNGARTLTIDFGEAVTGFDLSMLSVSNASASNLQDLGGGQYRVDLSASGDVNVTVSMAADQVSDAAGNLNTASNTFSYAYDDVAPAPVISGETALTNVVRTVTIDFGEAVSGFDLGGLILSNGTMNNLQDLGGGRYSVDLRGTGESTVYIYVDAGVAQDAATNLNTQSNTFSFAYDDIAPTPVIEGESTPTRTTRTLTLRFSEAVVGFGPEHISVRNGTASNFTDLGGLSWSIEVLGDADQQVEVSIAADQVADAAGNLNEASNTLSYWFEALTITPEASVVYNDAGAVTLRCSVDQANGPVTFNWYQRTEGGDEALGAGVVDGLTSTLELDASDPAWLGENTFYCVVEDAGGTSPSANVSVEIGARLSITTGIENAVVANGDPFTWTIGYSGGLGVVTIEWYRVTEEKGLDPIDDGDGNPLTLAFDAVESADAGAYEVHLSDTGDASGDFDAIVLSATLDVEYNVPLAGGLGLSLLSLTSALGGALALRRRKR